MGRTVNKSGTASKRGKHTSALQHWAFLDGLVFSDEHFAAIRKVGCVPQVVTQRLDDFENLAPLTAHTREDNHEGN